MLQIYKSTDSGLINLDQIEDGAWVNLINPDAKEINFVSNTLCIPIDLIRAALDEEERPRIEVDEGCTIVLIDIPIIDTPVSNPNVQANGTYYTVPLGIIIANKKIVTVSLKENSVIKDFIERKNKSFYTFKKTRFLLQILYKNSKLYLQYLRRIDKASSEIESSTSIPKSIHD